jgi:nitrite reductase/ring-hydroxylating ferredoxin subunit
MDREQQQWTRVLAADELEVGRPRTLKLSDRVTVQGDGNGDGQGRDQGQIADLAGAGPGPGREDGTGPGPGREDGTGPGPGREDGAPQRKQIVLFRLTSGEIHAIDNRCPHEGYPLSTGALKDGVLTCEWHNWKFRLCDGACILGGEGVRHYPVRVHDGAIWLDTADPPLQAAQPRLFASLAAAFEENDWGQAARTVERLLAAGAAPAEIVGYGCDWAAAHAPYGFDHGLATAADLVAILDQGDFADSPGVPILEALSLMGEPNLRRSARDMGAPEVVQVDRHCDWDAVEHTLRQRIEDEDVAGAEGLLRGALAAGAGPAEVFRWLTHAATDHFWDYGHAHIYTVKAEELLARIGWAHAHPVLTCLVTSLAYGTREDRLPYMWSYVDKMARHLPELARWIGHAGPGAGPKAGPGARPDADWMLAAVVDGNLSAALDAVASELDRGVAPDRIALVLGLCAAQRLLRFDHRLEHRDDVTDGWLSITHALTHADAVRESLRRRPSAEALRGLFLSARFVQHLGACDLPAAERTGPAAAAPDPDAADLGLTQALRRHDAAGAMAAVRQGLTAGAPVARVLRRFAVADGASLPIFVAHHIKTTMAALRLTDALSADPDLGGRPDRDLPALAAVRFLAHPLRERRVARRALVARDFVQAGRSPIRLLGY